MQGSALRAEGFGSPNVVILYCTLNYSADVALLLRFITFVSFLAVDAPTVFSALSSEGFQLKIFLDSRFSGPQPNLRISLTVLPISALSSDTPNQKTNYFCFLFFATDFATVFSLLLLNNQLIIIGSDHAGCMR